MANYTYDAFGNCTASGSMAQVNPIRYRGYYYDTETKWYYLNARYYSPEFRRFISPDDTSYLNSENVNGLNLYCYCGNDPINFVDPSGHDILMIIGLIGCFGIVVVLVSVTTGVSVSELLKDSKEKQTEEKSVDTVSKDLVSNLFEGSIDFVGSYFTNDVQGASSFANWGPSGAAGGGLFDPLCYTILTESFTGTFE